MIELDVQARRKSIVVDDDPPSNYLVLGDFGGRAAAPMAIDRDNFDGVLHRMDVQIAETQFRELDDFHPDRLFRRLPLFREFASPAAESPEDSRKDPAGVPQATPEVDIAELLRPSGLLEQIAEGGDPFEEYVRELARAHAAPKESSDSQRDAALGERMCGLLHHPQFQAIEAAWRGVDFVVRGGSSDEDSGSRVFLAQYSREDANRDLIEATSLRGTRMLELLNARKWRAIAGLYTFGPDAADIEFLGAMALLAAHVRAPFLAEGSVDMGPHWSELTAIPEASYVGLALPRFLLRLPYGARTSAIDSFAFEEMPGAPVHGRYLWGNPALACLTLLSRGGETLDLRGLPLHTFQKDGEWTMTPCAEVLMTEGQALALIEMGMMPLVSYAESDRVRLAGFRAINGKELAVA
jgi:type VI secretion system protein ImpC